MDRLSVTIITKNEEHNITRCLESVKWADEIVLVDCGSTDGTLTIAESYRNCRTFNIPWQGYGAQKQSAVDLAKHDWILSIDADEELSGELQSVIKNILQNPAAQAYSIRRKSFYLGKMINHSGWDHDYKLRLFRKNQGRFSADIVHESVIFSGKTERISAPIIHYTTPTITSHIKKIQEYSTLGARRLFDKNRSSTVIKAFFRGTGKFIKMFFLQLGFLDGKAGFILACLSGMGIFLKYIKLWEMRTSK